MHDQFIRVALAAEMDEPISATEPLIATPRFRTAKAVKIWQVFPKVIVELLSRLRVVRSDSRPTFVCVTACVVCHCDRLVCPRANFTFGTNFSIYQLIYIVNEC